MIIGDRLPARLSRWTVQRHSGSGRQWSTRTRCSTAGVRAASRQPLGRSAGPGLGGLRPRRGRAVHGRRRTGRAGHAGPRIEACDRGGSPDPGPNTAQRPQRGPGHGALALLLPEALRASPPSGGRRSRGPRVSNPKEQEIATLSPEQLRSARSEVEEAIRPYFPDDRMSLPAQAIMVTARK